jgi:hypothetical protein
LTTVIDKQSELRTLARAIFAGVATQEDLARVKAEEVYAIKSDTSEPRRSLHVFGKAEKGKGERTRRFIASTERVDRQGDIIRVKGWDLSDFKQNPVALWCHMSRDLPLGLVSEFVKDTKADTPALVESIDFHEPDLYPFADQVLRFIDAGGIRATSVGYIPLAGGVKYPATPEERDALGLGPWGVEYTKVSQLELSVCPVPAQADALGVKDIEKALGDLVREKKLTAAQAKSLLEAAAEPTVFALGGIGKDGEEEHEEDEHKPSALDKTLELLNATLEAVNRTLDANSALQGRVDQLERDLADLKKKSAAPGTSREPESQPATSDTRANAPEDFYAKALGDVVAKL